MHIFTKRGENIGYIYSITNTQNEKKYIGQTKNIKNRWTQHRSSLNNNHHHNKHLQAAWNKYGEYSFAFKIIEECDNSDMNERERYWIEKLDSKNSGYNLDKGGRGCLGYKHTEEELQKMRLIQNPKKVVQLDDNLSVIKVWDSCSHAGKTLNISIRQIKHCCERTGHQKTAKGFFWAYKEDYEKDDFDFSYFEIRTQKKKRVGQFDKKMNLINIFSSTKEASNKLHIGCSDISSVCLKKRRTAKGFVFRYIDDYSEKEYETDKQTDFDRPPVYSKDKLKSVSKYTLDGKFICTYDSARDASEDTGIKIKNIQYCCSGHSKTSGGYKWKYENNA